MNSDDYPVFTDPFYNELFKTWANLHSNEPQNAEEVCRQTIWKNQHIRVNGQGICYKNWLRHNVIFVQDIINQQGNIMSKQEISNEFQLLPKALEYESLLTAIPTQWKKMIKINKPLNKNYHVYKECKIKIEDLYCNIEGITTKEYIGTTCPLLIKGQQSNKNGTTNWILKATKTCLT
jgi:hypothetical protein